MTGHWTEAHLGKPPAPYGDTVTYELAAEWLKDCELVEDWGCGLGWSGRYFHHWRGVDGSQSPTVDEVVDLTKYRSWVPGLLLRHVLEHNVEWPAILDNALASFSKRMALILFTPMAVDRTQVIAWNYGYEVPDISFLAEDLEGRFPSDVRFTVEDLHTKSLYGVERIYYMWRGNGYEETQTVEVQEGRAPQAAWGAGREEDPGEEEGSGP
ncbi:MAG: hypothetical protein EHM35_14110, partial [Planctomycetaceae bacterium]